MSRDSVTLAITGASGVQYGLRLLQCLLQSGQQVRLLISAPAQVVIATETDLKLPNQNKEIETFLAARFAASAGQLRVYGRQQWTAPVASGSNVSRAMVVCPCSTGTLSAIAQGNSRSLIERAADVVLKERRQLILVPREAPLSSIHLENMLKLSRLGVTILPASPAFYHRPRQISELVDYVVARILDHLDIGHSLAPRWGEDLEP